MRDRTFLERAVGVYRGLLNRPLLLLLVVFIPLVALALWSVQREQAGLIRSMALAQADIQSRALKEFRTLYTAEVVLPAQKMGILVTHDYQSIEGAIPLPATLSMELGNRLAQDAKGNGAQLYSPHPFPWRQETGGLRDDFARQAWERFSESPDTVYSRVETKDGRLTLRYATPDRMRASCVQCHNTHPQTPKNDWKVGDVRGIIEVDVPLDSIAAQTQAGFLRSIGYVTTISLAFFSLLNLLLRRLKQSNIAAQDLADETQRVNDALVVKIEERKRAERGLRESNARRESILSASVDPMVTIDRHGVVLSVSDSLETVFGWKPEEVTGRNVSMLMPEPHRSMHDLYLDTYRQTGKTTLLGVTRELPALRKDGTVFPCELTVSRVDVPGEESPLFTGILRNVTEQKQTETAMRENEERIRLLLDSTGEGIYGLDLEGNCTFCNPTCIELLGYESETDLLGKNMHNLIHHTRPDGSPYPMEQCRIYQAFRLGQGVHIDDEVLWRADGSRFEAEYRSNPIRRDGKVIGSVVTFTDITKRKQAEREKEELEAQLRQSQKQEAIGSLAGGISHDFNNILTAIRGFGELAYEDAPKESPLLESIEEIITASDRAAKLVNQILTFSRKADEDRKPVDLRNIIDEAMRLLRSTIPSTITIAREFSGHRSTAFADATQIHQVIVNLVTNAAMAIGTNGGKIGMTLEPCAIDDRFAATHSPLRPGPHLRFRVRDTGCGMTPEILDQAFEPFFTTKDVDEGTGMGLAVVHAIIRRHEGVILLESERDKGTTVTVLLPEEPRAAQVEAPGSKRSLSHNETGRIMLVDDEKILLNLQTKVLERLGYDVVSMDSSRDALELFLADPKRFDLVITDLTMPEMMGDALASKMLDARPDLRVILCTGFSEEMGEEKAFRIGVRCYLKKPFSMQALAESVREILQR